VAYNGKALFHTDLEKNASIHKILSLFIVVIDHCGSRDDGRWLC
jgi:hypothetical protein